MAIPGKDSYEVQWQAQELRRDMKKDVTDWLQGPGTIKNCKNFSSIKRHFGASGYSHPHISKESRNK